MFYCRCAGDTLQGGEAMAPLAEKMLDDGCAEVAEDAKQPPRIEADQRREEQRSQSEVDPSQWLAPFARRRRLASISVARGGVEGHEPRLSKDAG